MEEIVRGAMSLVGAAVLAAILWFLWRMWRSGSEEAKQFDRERRREQNLCPECEYDLRGSPGAERCPECGADLRPGPPADAAPLDGSRLDPQKLAHDWPVAAIEPEPAGPAEELVPVHFTRMSPEAELVQQQLLARGVWCRMEQRQEYTVGPVISRIPQYSILVRPEERDRAEAIMDRFRLKVGE